MPARAWITDGSLPVFSDTRRLDATHPVLPGLRTRYEGFVDAAVPLGSAAVDGIRPDDQLFLEAEWVVQLAGGLQGYVDDPDGIGPDTPIVLQGMIEGKWMNRLLGTRAWQPASLGNNVIAEGPGIETTLGALETDELGAIRVTYRDGRGDRRTHTTAAADLRGHNVLGLVRAVAGLCAENGDAVDVVDLGAAGEHAAVVNERARIRASVRPFPAAHRSKERLVRRALSEGIGLPPGESATIVVVDHRGDEAGRGTLVWRAATTL